MKCAQCKTQFQISLVAKLCAGSSDCESTGTGGNSNLLTQMNDYSKPVLQHCWAIISTSTLMLVRLTPFVSENYFRRKFDFKKKY